MAAAGEAHSALSRIGPFLLYLAGVFFSALVLAYPAWLAVQAAGMDSVPFNKLCFRLLQACALAGLWPLMHHLRLRAAADWGFGRGQSGTSPARGILIGLVAGMALLFLIVAVLLVIEVRVVRPAGDYWHPAALATLAGKALLAGFVIALIEETWFRGALQRAFELRFGAGSAILTTAILYAMVHFVRPDVAVPADEVGWLSGAVVIAGAFGRFSDPAVIDSFAALFAAGILLALVRHRCGRIWECIGLHAGFVVVIRLTRKFTELQPDSPYGYLVGGFDGVIGWLGFAVLAAAAAGYVRLRTGGTSTHA